jgi:uncharacterized lipoprotein YajG
MRPVHRIAVILVLVSLGCCAKAPPPLLENMPLVWMPSSQATFGAVNLSDVQNSKIQIQTLADARTQPQLVAENREGPTPKPVTTRDNVAEFVTTHLREILQNVGLNVVAANGDVTLSGEVRQFFVLETSTYTGNVVLHLTLRGRGGAVLWNGITTGSTRTFGRSYSADNYNKVLSDSLTEAVAKLLQDADFRRALARR